MPEDIKAQIASHLQDFKNAKIIATAGIERYENGDKKFAKFFLLNDEMNINKWQVTADSISRFIRTFIGRPFVSEPNLKHFGAENMSLDEVLKVQETFRAGNIIDVQTDGESAYAIVEFSDNALGRKTWEDLNKGEAIYVSPAITGSGKIAGGAKLFTDWFGLHLARVGEPAYGVFHATIKATCEGGERNCIRNLMATASIFISSNDSFNIEGFSCSKMNNQASTTETSTAQVSTIETRIADVEAKLNTIQTAYTTVPGGTSNPSMEGKTTPVIDPSSDGAQAQASANTIKAMKAEIANLKKSRSAALASEIVSMKNTASMYAMEKDMEEDEKELAAMDSEELEKEMASIKPYVAKITQMASASGKLPNTETRIVHQVASASADKTGKPTNLNDLRKLGMVD